MVSSQKKSIYKYPDKPHHSPPHQQANPPCHHLLITLLFLRTLLSQTANMGIKNFIHEYKSNASASRMFKALFTKGHEEVPKFVEPMKSVEIVGGGDFCAGCVWQSTLAEGTLKHKIDEVDAANHECKFTLIEGGAIGDKIEKVCYHLKFEPSSDGGCVVKINNEYHSKPGVELTDEDIKADTEMSLGMTKGCEAYLLANPDACA